MADDFDESKKEALEIISKTENLLDDVGRTFLQESTIDLARSTIKGRIIHKFEMELERARAIPFNAIWNIKDQDKTPWTDLMGCYQGNIEEIFERQFGIKIKNPELGAFSRYMPHWDFDEQLFIIPIEQIDSWSNGTFKVERQEYYHKRWSTTKTGDSFWVTLHTPSQVRREGCQKIRSEVLANEFFRPALRDEFIQNMNGYFLETEKIKKITDNMLSLIRDIPDTQIPAEKYDIYSKTLTILIREIEGELQDRQRNYIFSDMWNQTNRDESYQLFVAGATVKFGLENELPTTTIINIDNDNNNVTCDPKSNFELKFSKKLTKNKLKAEKNEAFAKSQIPLIKSLMVNDECTLNAAVEQVLMKDPEFADTNVDEKTIKSRVRRQLVNGLNGSAETKNGMTAQGISYDDGYNYWVKVDNSRDGAAKYFIQRGKDFSK